MSKVNEKSPASTKSNLTLKKCYPKK